MICDIEFRVKLAPPEKILTGNPVRKGKLHSAWEILREGLYFV